jgi:hypothetical protein
MRGNRLLVVVDDPGSVPVPDGLADACTSKEWLSMQLASLEDVVDISILWTRLGAHRQVELAVAGPVKAVGRCTARHGVVPLRAPLPLATHLSELLEAQLQDVDQLVFLDRPPPQLSAELIDRLADAGRSGVGLLPDLDGSLIGLSLNRWNPELFDGVLWGAPECARQIAERAGWCGLLVGVMPPLVRADEADALPHLLEALLSLPGAGVRTRKNPVVSRSKS